jgi:hypothetical protein
MIPLATIGALIEVTPRDDVQYFPDLQSDWTFIEDRSPFFFRVSGELKDQGSLFGLHGPVESGPERYLGLICNILIRYDDSDWRHQCKGGASFKLGPTITERVAEYDPALHDDIPFYIHPEGTVVHGHPQFLRYGGIQTVAQDKTKMITSAST